MTIDTTGTIRDLDFGSGTQYQVDPAGIGGLGSPTVKTADTQFDGRDGSFGAPDFLDIRVITIPLIILGESPEDATSLLDDLNDAFAPCRDGVDITLELTLPGWGTARAWTGRPRGVDVDSASLKNSTLRALCRFDALDPNYA